MKDLELHQQLREGRLDESLVEPLSALAMRTVERRVAFLGFLEPCLTHESAELRAVALQCLAGCRGPRAIRSMVAALDDPVETVRFAAVDALAESGHSHPARYAHALFHPDPAIRRRALESCPPPAHDLAARLFADPECADRIDRVELPAQDVGFMLGLVERGHLDVATARAWLLARSPDVLMRFLLAHLTPGGVHRLLALFVDGPEDDRLRIHRRLASLATRNERVGALLAESMREEAVRDPEGPALELALRIDLGVLLEERIDERYRRAALVGLGGARPPSPNDTEERAALAERVFDELLRPGGELDWAGAFAMASLVTGGQLSFLLGQLHPEAGGPGSSRRKRTKLMVDRAIAHPLEAYRLLRVDVAAIRRFGAATKGLMGPTDPRAPLAGVLLAACVHRRGVSEDLSAVWEPDDLFHALAALEPRVDLVLDSEVALRAFAVGLRLHLGREGEWHRVLTTLRPDDAFGERILISLAGLGSDTLTRTLLALETEVLVSWLEPLGRLLSGGDGAANALLGHADPRVRAWAKERQLFTAPPPEEDRPQLHDLTNGEVARIRAGGGVTLAHPLRRLTEALVFRLGAPERQVCLALLACGDPYEEVAAALDHWSGGGAIFGPSFDGALVDAWFGEGVGSMLLDAWLYRWEQLAERAAKRVFELGPAFLASAAAWPCAELTDRLFRAVGRELSVARYRGPIERVERWATEAWIDAFIGELDTPHGVGAARALNAIAVKGVAHALMEQRREAVHAKLADFTDDVREALREWISSRGLPPRQRARRIVAGRAEKLAAVKVSEDLDQLTEWLGDWAVGEDAAIRLVLLGERGERRLLSVIDVGSERAVVAARAALLFEHVGADELRERLANPSIPTEARFLLAMALEDDEAAVAVACEPLVGESWLRVEDAERLRSELGERFATLAASSPHPAAYQLAMKHALLDEDLPAIRRFLMADDQRDGQLRFRCALRLHGKGHALGGPILWENALLGGGIVHDIRTVDDVLVALADGVLRVGTGKLEEVFFERVNRISGPIEETLWGAALRDGNTKHTRVRAAGALTRWAAGRRRREVSALAEVFAWGTKRGLELTGRLMRFHLISDPKAFGYTDLRTRDVHITAQPLLRDEPDGARVVEGLVLHELGHQLYHREKDHLEVWERAGQKRMRPLMNLVLDEHLERRLRAIDAEFGDRLKTLAAYAFQHGGRSMIVVDLVQALGVDAALALIASELSVADEPDCVRVGNGPLLGALERQGNSFARFFRALRMGLGDRHDDPKVREGLALFGRRFRHSSAEELWEIALELRRIFGDEVTLADHIGGHETGGAGELEGVTDTAGIEDEEVQREVERILEPPKKSQGGSSRARGGLAINVGADDSFSPITEVERLPVDRDKHREVMREVALPARRLRRAFEELGVRSVPQRRRLRGHRLDRTQLQALALKGDPRILVSRERVLSRDLFLGMAIDCSGSMVGESMDKAHRFGVLLAEATRGLDGVDTRIFGFTDSIIFDCGDSENCAVTTLESGGGNNDAAGLAHVAEHAYRSRRAAKLLVMISDGLPTECSVDALRGLSRRLARDGLMNAQIAVRPLEEQCFDHYIEVLDEDYAAAAMRFGKVLTKLASSVLR